MSLLKSMWCRTYHLNLDCLSVHLVISLFAISWFHVGDYGKCCYEGSSVLRRFDLCDCLSTISLLWSTKPRRHWLSWYDFMILGLCVFIPTYLQYDNRTIPTHYYYCLHTMPMESITIISGDTWTSTVIAIATSRFDWVCCKESFHSFRATRTLLFSKKRLLEFTGN